MKPRKRPLPRAQAGFSMVEMLMAAFILSIGILGVTMLQVMSLRASRGGRSLTTAVHVAEHVLDQVELEGRLAWLNVTDSDYTAAKLPDSLRYINADGAKAVEDAFNLKGTPVDNASTDPTENTAVFKSTVMHTDIAGPTTGKISDYTVVVTFQDDQDATNKPVNRTVTLTRRIIHA